MTMNMHGWKVGDRITFRAATFWGDGRAATRVVRGFTQLDWPTVRFGGWADFIVRPSEVSKWLPREEQHT